MNIIGAETANNYDYLDLLSENRFCSIINVFIFIQDYQMVNNTHAWIMSSSETIIIITVTIHMHSLT